MNAVQDLHPLSRPPSPTVELEASPAYRRLAFAAGACRRLWLALALAGLAGACLPAAARASFTHATLVSGAPEQPERPAQQFEEANEPAVSQSSEYVVFQGVLAGTSGVWRRDLATGAVEAVAEGEASSPSISANGRYVAFTTTQDFEPEEGGSGVGEPPGDAGCPEVYVRDMDVSEGPAEYTLASELNHSSEGIKFEPGHACGGAQSATDAAMSADGEEVVFTVDSASNLAGPGTPPGQVAVRNLLAKTTTLMTVTQEAGGAQQATPVEGGGAFPDAYSQARGAYGGSTAAISADGSTVAWFGMNVGAQVSPAEASRGQALSPGNEPGELEPLWRRVNGSGAGTRRLLAGAGLSFYHDPAPVPEGTPVRFGAWDGMPPYGAPTLSEDGDTVAVLANAPPPSALQSIEENTVELHEYESDAYIVHVGEAPSSLPQVTPVTEVGSYLLPGPARAKVTDIAISPNGEHVAFDTARTPLESPSFAMVSPPTPKSVVSVYEVNLELGTLQRVTAAYNGGETNGPMGALAFGNNQTLAFASGATNLFYGDGVGGWQVFEVEELPGTDQLVGTHTSEAPTLELPQSEWTLGATVTTQPDGSMVVYARVPASGQLAVQGRAQLPGQIVPAATSHGHRRGGKAKRSARAKSGRAPVLVTRTVARAQDNVAGPEEVAVRVRVNPAYQSLLTSADGIYTIVRVTFTALGRSPLVREIPVTLRMVTKPHAHATRKPTSSKHRADRRGTASGRRNPRE